MFEAGATECWDSTEACGGVNSLASRFLSVTLSRNSSETRDCSFCFFLFSISQFFEAGKVSRVPVSFHKILAAEFTGKGVGGCCGVPEMLQDFDSKPIWGVPHSETNSYLGIFGNRYILPRFLVGCIYWGRWDYIMINHDQSLYHHDSQTQSLYEEWVERSTWQLKYTHLDLFEHRVPGNSNALSGFTSFSLLEWHFFGGAIPFSGTSISCWLHWGSG